MVEQRTGIAALLPPGMCQGYPVLYSSQMLYSLLTLRACFPSSGLRLMKTICSQVLGSQLPPLIQGLEDGTLSGEEPVLRTQVTLAICCLFPSASESVHFAGTWEHVYVPEIDPVLFNKCGHGSSGRTDLEPADDADIMATPVNTLWPTFLQSMTRVIQPPCRHANDFSQPAKPTLIRRTAAPAPLELTSLRTTTSNFTSHRNTDDSSPTTPGSANSCYSSCPSRWARLPARIRRRSQQRCLHRLTSTKRQLWN